ncbi:MAG: carboxypeptidase-like regulatory domain-containing protein [Bacteroidota bacterium]|nr:carboxypeptidase-like regulatory domain-containing protein [Bacteroidota bacterium]MDP3147043.1 carboxypeptidase-like regulatory domain-containing protein [Bacteroidota bacterium]
MKIIIAFSFLIFFILIGGCKKKAAGVGGKNSISGTINFKNGTSGNNEAAPLAWVSIAYGTNEATSSFDQTILTDASGSYKIEGLNKGDYFIKAGYTDVNGFSYTNSGVGLTFENKKKNLEVNIVLE